MKVAYVDENYRSFAPTEIVVENQPWYNTVEVPKKEFEGYEFLSSGSPLKDLVMPGERTVTLRYRQTEKFREIPFDTIYTADETKEKGVKETVREGVVGKEGYKTKNGVDDPQSIRTVNPKVDKLVKVGTKPTTEVTNTPSTVRYEKDASREKGTPDERIDGKQGTSTVPITYTVDRNSGEITEHRGTPNVVASTPTIIKVGAKDKVVETPIPSPVRYEKDDTREVGTPNETELGDTGSRTVTTTYEVNKDNGNISENVGQPVIKDPTETVIKVGAKDKIEKENISYTTRYEKDETREYGTPNEVAQKGVTGTVTTVTTYDVDSQTGNVTEHKGQPETIQPVEEVIKVGAKDKEVVSTIPYIVRYISDNTRMKGEPNIVVVQGKDGTSTIVTKYNVNTKTGEVTENVGEPIVVNPVYKVIKVANKTDFETFRKGHETIERETSYTVNEKTGELTPKIVERVTGSTTPTDDDNNLITPPVVEIPEYTEPIGITTPIDENEKPILPPVVEIPEYTKPIGITTPIDENENPILPPVVEIPEYTKPIGITTPIDENENPILPPVVEIPEYKGEIKNEENKEPNNVVPQVEETPKRVLPKTNAFDSTAYLLGLLLSSAGYKLRKKKQ